MTALNMLLGWTFVGWVAALVKPDPQPPQPSETAWCF